MQTEILNLDDFEGDAVKTFVFKGVTHEMRSLSVGSYIKQLKQIEKLDTAGDNTAALEFMLNSVCEAFPTFKRAEAEKLSFAQVKALMDHINGIVQEAAEEGN